MGFWSDLWTTAFRDFNHLTDDAPPPEGAISRQYPGRVGGQQTTAGEKFDDGFSGYGAAPTIDHNRARSQARKAYIDSLQAHSLVQRFADSVVDLGLRLKPVPVSTLLPITPEQVEDWAQDVERRFDLWAKSRIVDRAEMLNLYQMQRLVAVGQHRDGEYFVRVYYDGEGPNPIQLRVIEPNLIQGHAFTSTEGYPLGETDGIKRDAKGRAVQYTLMAYDPRTGNSKEVKVQAKTKQNLPLMLHGFQAEWPDQTRGYPRFLHALQEFKNLTDFTMAQIKKAILQSTIAMFNKPSATAPASNPFEGISQTVPAGPASTLSSFGGAVVEGESLGVDDRVRYTPLNTADFGVPGAVGVFNLEEGEELKPFVSTAPAEGYVGFVQSFTTHLAASVGIPQEVLLMKFDQSYSAARGALIMFWRVAQIWRAELVSDFLKPIYEAWLGAEIAAQRITAPGWADPLMREAWTNCAWSGVPMPNIDPMKTAKADQLYIELGAQTLQDVAHNFAGSNAEDNMGRLKREFEKLPTAPWKQVNEPNPGGRPAKTEGKLPE